MTFLPLLAAVVLLAGAWWYQSTHGLLATRRRKRTVVTLKTGESFSGVLFATDREALVLRSADALGIGENRSNVAVDGEVLILRSDVAYVQLP